MGKAAPVCVADDLQSGIQTRILVKSNECEAKAVVGDKTYLIGGSDDEPGSLIGVRIFDNAVGEWVNPTILGTRPRTSKGYSMVVLNEEKILVIKKESTPDDCIWFLEVQTPFVKERKEILGTEFVAWSKGVRGNTEKPIVISGPSGVGKGTVISMLMKEFPSMFGFSVSHTTRAPREMECDGVHYHFTEKRVMEKEIEDGKFLEFANVHGNLYGTSIEAVEVVADAGKRCILDIDVQGARSVRASSLEAIFIFICPPSMKELEKRLRARGTEKEEQILKRLKNAEAEIEQGKSSGIFDHILYNDNLEECYQNLKRLLGLDETVAATPRSPQGIDLPPDHSVAMFDNNKITIKCETQDNDNNSKSLIVLDVSSLKGGAPGRTRGIEEKEEVRGFRLGLFFPPPKNNNKMSSRHGNLKVFELLK